MQRGAGVVKRQINLLETTDALTGEETKGGRVVKQDGGEVMRLEGECGACINLPR